MSVTLNVEWLVWTVEMPPKVYLHDQDVIGEGANKTSIPLNPAKSWTIRGWWKMTIKGRGGQHEQGSRKNQGKNKREEFLLNMHFHSWNLSTQNFIKSELLNDCFIVYIKREIAKRN